MKRLELEKKYRKKLVEKILSGNYLNGCTIGVNKDGSTDYYEIDIINAIKEINGLLFEWD